MKKLFLVLRDYIDKFFLLKIGLAPPGALQPDNFIILLTARYSTRFYTFFIMFFSLQKEAGLGLELSSQLPELQALSVQKKYTYYHKIATYILENFYHR